MPEFDRGDLWSTNEDSTGKLRFLFETDITRKEVLELKRY